jgi:hypothetical protein
MKQLHDGVEELDGEAPPLQQLQQEAAVDAVVRLFEVDLQDVQLPPLPHGEVELVQGAGESDDL